MTATSVPISVRGRIAGHGPGHGLTVHRVDDIQGYAVLYEGSCSCGRWSDKSRFRKLVSDAYARHVVEAQRDPDGKHDELRRTLRALRGPLAPSTEGDPA